MVRKRETWRKVVFILLTLFIIAGGLFQPVFAEGDKDPSSETEKTEQDAAVVESNVKGNLTKDGQPLGNVTLSIHTTKEPIQWFDAVTDSDGQFELFLNDGEYQLDGVWIPSEEKWYVHEVPFKVVNGKMEGLKNLEIALTSEETAAEEPGNGAAAIEATQANVSGKVVKGTSPIANNIVNIQNTGDGEWYNPKTDSTGSFALYLPDGSYQIAGIWVETEEKWYPHPAAFTVQGGKLAGQTELQFDLHAEKVGNVSGKIVNGSAQITDVWVSAKPTGSVDDWVLSNAVTDATGAFTINLPDGEYEITGIWVGAEEKWYPHPVVFSVVDGNLAGQTELLIDLQSEKTGNVTGKVVKGTTTITDVWVSAKPAGSGDEWILSNAVTDSTGAFAIALPDGDYQITGIWVDAEAKWYPHVVDLSVQGGKLVKPTELIIDIQTDTIGIVSGKVVNGTTPITGVWISPKTVDTDLQYYRSIEVTDETGAFTIQLPDGDYQIDGIWVDSEAKWYPQVVPFTVQEGKLVGQEEILIDLQAKKTGNVSGKVLKGETPITDIWVSAKPNGTEEKWYRSEAVTDAAGTFSLNLPDGDYQIIGIWIDDEQKWYPHVVEFTVQDGTLSGQTELLINLEAKPADNVTGTVFDGQSPLPNATVYLINNETNDFYGIDSDADGHFSIQLTDGNYTVKSVWPQNEQEIYLYKKFSVIGGKLTIDNAPVEKLDLTLPSNSLVLEITEDGSPIDLSLVYIWNDEYGDYTWGYPDETGKIVFRLPDGNYEVEGYYDNEGFYHYLHKPVEVMNGTTNPSPFVINVETSDIAFGEVRDENGVLPYAEFYIEDVDYNWQYLVQADAKGSYAINLSDGNYFIHEIYKGTDLYAAVDIAFTVTGGKVYVQGQEMNPFNITVPAKTLTGKLQIAGSPLAGELYFEREINGYTYYYNGATDANGNFALRVPDGTYTITTAFGKNDWFDVSTTVEVAGGVTVPNPFVIDVKQGNVNGSVADANGSPIANTDFFIESAADASYFWVTTDDQGKFTSFVPDGNYYIHEVWNGTTYVYPDLFFAVAGGKVQWNGSAVEDFIITLPGETLKAKLVDGETPLSGYVFASREVNGVTLQYGAYTDKNGHFVLQTADGVYSIDSLSGSHGSYEIAADVEVKDGTTNPSPYVINIVKVSGNMQGIVKDGSGILSNGSLTIERYTEAGLDGWYYANTNSNGEFGTQLPDGSYRIIEFEDSNGILGNLDVHFTIENGVLAAESMQDGKIIVNVPSITLQVSLLDGNTPVAAADVYILSDSGYIYAVTNDQGVFAARLQDGSYIIDDVYFGNEVVRFNKELAVTGGNPVTFELQLPAVNVSGKLKDGDENLAGYDLTVYDQNGNYYRAGTDADGSFSLRLPDGEFVVHAATFINDSYEYVNYPLNAAFTIVNGTQQGEGGPLNLSLSPEALHAQVVNNGIPVANAEIRFSRVLNDQFIYFYGSTDENGIVSYRVPDGEYTLENVISTEGFTDIYQVITVENGTTNPNPIMIDISGL